MAYATVKDVQLATQYAELSQMVKRPSAGAAQAQGLPQTSVPAETPTYTDDPVLWDDLLDSTKQEIIPTLLEDGASIIDGYINAQYSEIDYPISFPASPVRTVVTQFQEWLKRTNVIYVVKALIERIDTKKREEYETQINKIWKERLDFLLAIQRNEVSPPALKYANLATTTETDLPAGYIVSNDVISVELPRSKRNGIYLE